MDWRLGRKTLVSTRDKVPVDISSTSMTPGLGTARNRYCGKAEAA
jgi:hypothetical protein